MQNSNKQQQQQQQSIMKQQKQVFQNINPNQYPDSQQQYFKKSMSFGDDSIDLGSSPQKNNIQNSGNSNGGQQQQQMSLQNKQSNYGSNNNANQQKNMRQQIDNESPVRSNYFSPASSDNNLFISQQQQTQDIMNVFGKSNGLQNFRDANRRNIQNQIQVGALGSSNYNTLEFNSANNNNNNYNSNKIALGGDVNDTFQSFQESPINNRGTNSMPMSSQYQTNQQHQQQLLNDLNVHNPSTVFQNYNRTRDSGGTLKVINHELGFDEHEFLQANNNNPRLHHLENQNNNLTSTIGRVITNEENFNQSIRKPNSIDQKAIDLLFGQSLLIITVRCAEKLKNTEIFLKSDPFVEVEFNGEIYRTNAINNNLDPFWNQKFTFLIDDRISIDSVVKFRMYDDETFLSNKLMGACEIQLGDLLIFKKNQEIPLKLKKDEKGVMKEIGTLKIMQKAKRIIRGSTLFAVEPTTQQKLQAEETRRNKLGIFKLCVHHFEGIELLSSDYQVSISVESIPDPSQQLHNAQNSPPEIVIVKKKGTWQIQKECSFKAAYFFTSKCVIQVKKKTFAGINSNVTARFECNLGNAYDFLDGQTIGVELVDDLHKNTKDLKDTASPPRVFLSIQYFNSFFTRHLQTKYQYPGQNVPQLQGGIVNMKVKALIHKGKSFPSTYYVNIKHGAKNIALFERLHQQSTLKVQDSMEPMILTIFNKKLGLDTEIATYKILPYELFKNNDQIVYQEIYQHFQFVDKELKSEVLLSIVTKYSANNMKEEDYKREGQDKNLVSQQQPKDIKDLLRVQSTNNKNLNDDSLDQENEEVSRQKDPESGEKDEDLFNLDIVGLKTILESKKGVLIMKVRGAKFEWEDLLLQGAGQKDVSPINMKEKIEQSMNEEEPSFYVIIKSSRAACKTKCYKDIRDPNWDEMLDFKVQDPLENYTIKLYQEGPAPILLAEGMIIAKEVFQDRLCWTVIQLNVLLELVAKPSYQIPLNIDLQYRCSNFTRVPRGKMEVSLMSGHQLKYKGAGFNKPLFVFRMGLQNFQLCEEIQPNHARWNNRMVSFETSSLWDVLDLRIYESSTTSANNQLSLIGSIQKPLNSIYYDEDSTSLVTFNLIDASDLLFGTIKVQFDYIPIRKGFESDLADVQSDNLITNAGARYRKNDENLGMSEKKKGVCFLTLRNIKIQGMDNDQNYNVENVRLEINYSKQKCLSKITTDLNKTQNKETLNDQFRLILDDISNIKQDIQKIQIKAFDIDYKGNQKLSEIQMLIGECCIEPYILRMHQGLEFHYQCAIEISDFHFIKKLQKAQQMNGSGNLEDSSLLLLNDMIDEKEEREALQFLNAKSEVMQRQKRKELIINFTIVYISTNFTKSPFGMITINDIALLNLNNYLLDNFFKDTGSVYVVFKMNGNKNNTTNGKLVADQKMMREKMCLFHQEYDPVDVMRGGDDFYVKKEKLQSQLCWDKQIVLFTSSPLDQLEIEIIFDKSKSPSYQNLMKNDPNNINNKSKVVLANILLNVADISYFLDKSATREVGVASLMDFQGSPEYNPQNNLILKQYDSKAGGGQALMQQLKMQKMISAKDLCNQAYSRQLILLMDVKFASDVFIEKDQMKNNLSVDHLFMIPREVKYDDYINQGYDAWLKKNQNKQAILPSSPTKKNNGSLPSSPTKVGGPRTSIVSSPKKNSQLGNNNHMLLEFHLINLNSILRDIIQQSNIYCFIAFEYLSNTDSVSSYIKQSGRYLKNQLKKQNDEKNAISQGFVNATNTINSASDNQLKGNRLNHVFGDIINDFFAPAEDLLSLDTQMTDVFGINDFEIHTINEMLEGWVPITTNKIMLSLIIQQNKHDQLDFFRDKLLQQILTKDTTILGIQKFGAETDFSNIEIYQTPIDFELINNSTGDIAFNSNMITPLSLNEVPSTNKPQQVQTQQLQEHTSYEPSILKTFTQCANLAELALSGNLLMNPITRAQCLVKTRLQTSKFIDTPSGYLNVALKKFSYNSLNFNQENFVRLTLRSKVHKDKIINFNSSICDIKETQQIGFYKKRSEKNNKTVVMLNEVANYIVRHFADALIVSVYSPPERPKDNIDLNQQPIGPPILVFQTKVELNNLDLNEEKLTIMVVGTHPMRNKGSPVYYTFELDLLFKSKLMSEKDASSLDFAYENYKMLKGSDILTEADVQIIQMLMERAALASKLIPNRIRMRKAFFILRNMIKTSYQTIDLEQQSHFKVLPKSFFFNLNDPNLNLTQLKYQDIMQTIKSELAQGNVKQGQNQGVSVDIKYKGQPLEKNGQIEKSNMLLIEFLSNIQFQGGGTGVLNNTQRSMVGFNNNNNNNQQSQTQLGLSKVPSGQNPLNASMTSFRSLTGMSVQALMRYKKMVLVVNQDQQTVYKHTFEKVELISGQFFKGLRIFIKDVQATQTLTFRILVEEEKDQGLTKTGSSFNNQTASKGQQSAFGNSGEGKLTELGMTSMQIGSLFLKTWTRQEKTLAIKSFNVNVGMTLLYSDFTKNPHKVVNFSFHRLISLTQDEIVSRYQGNQEKKEDNKNNQISPQQNAKTPVIQGTNNKKNERLIKLLNSERFNYKLVMREEPIVTKNNFKNMLILDHAASNLSLNQINSGQSNTNTSPNRIGNTMRQSFAKNYFQSASKSQVLPQDGSVNKKIEELQSQNGIEQLNAKLKLIMEFDNCLEYKGEVKDTRVYEVDQFGRNHSSSGTGAVDLEKIMINNTKSDNKIIFKLCLDNTAQGNNDYSMNSKANVVIASTSLYLAEVQTLPNQTLNFFIPLASIAEHTLQSEDISTKWALQNYALNNNVYILGSIKITDKTFGELAINIDQFKNVTKSLELRELQYRVQVRPNNVQSKELMLQTIMSKTQEQQELEKNKLKNIKDNKEPELSEFEKKKKEKEALVSIGAPQEIKNYETYSFESQRIEYSITVSQYKIDREFNIPLALKDIFADQDAFLSPKALEQNAHLDNKLVFQFLGYDNENNCIELGQIELSMLEMIQRQMLYEQNKVKAKNQLALASQSGEFKTQQYSQVAQKKIDNEFAGTSAKFQKLFKDSYVRYNQTREVLQKKKEDEIQAKQQEKEEQKLQLSQQFQQLNQEPLPDGFQLIKFDKPTPQKDPLQDLIEFSQKASPVKQNPTLQKSLNQEMMSDVIVKIEWNFSYKARAQHSDKFFEINEELRQLERIKQKKNIDNLLNTLEQVQTVPMLTHKNLKTLALVLASDSCMSYSSEEELFNSQGLQNVEKIISVLTQLYKEARLEMHSLVELMRSITYLKILCDCHPKYKQLFNTTIKKSLLIETMIETYQTNILSRDGNYLQSKSAGIEFMGFISTLLLDFHDIYFEMISGVRLDPLLQFVNDINKNDYNIIAAYAKFLNAVGQCLFKFKSQSLNYEDIKNDKHCQFVKMDLMRISKVINDQLVHLVSGGLSVYKNDYEVVAETICKSAIQFVHLSLLQSRLVTNEDSFTLPDILLNLFKILVDGIISQLSLDFINDLKNRLNYEISMIKSLDLKEKLLLIFDDSILIGMMKRLTQHFQSIMKTYDQDKRVHGFRFYEKTKLIFEFFATEQCMNAFAENIRAIEKVEKTNILSDILTDKSVEDYDFVLFLHKVIKIDAEIESVNGDQKGNANAERERKAKFMSDKYGNIQKVNKFSLTRIGWLDTLYNNDL